MKISRYVSVSMLVCAFFVIGSEQSFAKDCEYLAKIYTTKPDRMSPPELVELGGCIKDNKDNYKSGKISTAELSKISCGNIAKRYSNKPADITSQEAKKLLQCIANDLRSIEESARDVKRAVPGW